MQSNRLGCLTATGIIAALATALIIAGMVFVQGDALYSPGALNAKVGQVLGGVTSHAATGGNCKACHTAPWESVTMADRCTSCHAEIATQMRNVAALHGAISHNNASLSCYHCHPDHRGADAPLTLSQGADFPHQAVGFPLTGKHATIKCDQCHQNNIFTTASKDCNSCHAKDDSHGGKFGTDCSTCHSSDGWKPATFDHNLSAFKLEGRHADVSCDKCHINGVFKGTPTDCYSCHKQNDRHNGQFGTDCAACHTPARWGDATFDHNKSNFPLTGAHTNLACEKCHANGQFKGLNTACASCHTDPAFHAGLFKNVCSDCHTTAAWSPAQYNGPHPAISGGEGGSGIDHGGATCRDCHTVNLSTATCTKCHDSNNPGGGG